MSFELIFLTMLVTGIVLIGIGLMQHVRGYRGRALNRVREVFEASYEYARGIRNVPGEVRREVKPFSGEAYGRFGKAAKAYQEINDIESLYRVGEISAAEREALIKERQPIHQAGTRRLQEGLGKLYQGGSRGTGIYGEREGGLYGTMMGFFQDIGLNQSLEYIKRIPKNINDIIQGWRDRRRRDQLVTEEIEPYQPPLIPTEGHQFPLTPPGGEPPIKQKRKRIIKIGGTRLVHEGA